MTDRIEPAAKIESISSFYHFQASVDVLRLDQIHPLVSGNKWFKLKEYIAGARNRHHTILTYGGAYSNHIVATAAAAKAEGLKSIGLIRGEKPTLLSHTLQQAEALGMRLVFASREQYRHKVIPDDVFLSTKRDETYVIPEGGYGAKGAEGAKDILRQNDAVCYTHILSAVGTGTTIAGLIAAARKDQKIIGIPVLKNAFSLQDEINALLPEDRKNDFELLHDFHFGGYAKHTKSLFDFMNDFYFRTGIPTDFVYTAKAFFAAGQLANGGVFSAADKVLIIHTGGLQGNLSLPKGTLIFR